MTPTHQANVANKGRRVYEFLVRHLGDQLDVDFIDRCSDDEWARIGQLAGETTPDQSRAVIRALVAASASVPADPFAGLGAMS